MKSFWLAEIQSLEQLKRKFIEEFNWDSPSLPSYTITNTTEFFNTYVDSIKPVCEKLRIYKILFLELKNIQNPEKQLRSIERKIILNSSLKNEIQNTIFVFSYNNFEYLDFVKAEKIGSTIRIKRFAISPNNRDKLRTPTEQIEKLNLKELKIDFSTINDVIENVYSVESVTKKFYDEYIEVFKKIKKLLIKQKVENIEPNLKESKLNDFIHLVLNRIMFLYFIQKRGCFNNDKNFIENFYLKYKETNFGKNKFHNDWLNVLFFDSLSQPPWLYKVRPYLGSFNDVLKYAPYLNGGLFEKHELDKIGWQIPDSVFDDIFDFFGSYNFTIEESTPLEVDIAIDPEMMGNIYEHMINVEEQEEQKKAGIFYTPKVEIEFMIRRALVEFLYNKTQISRNKLYKFLFKELGEEIENPFDKDEAKKVLDELDKIFILDPACGSGHYLIVAVGILYDLKKVLYEFLNIPLQSKYDEKKKIIENNIYGNDIKPWAVSIAKLRLWLELFVDAEDFLFKDYSRPLLPDLNFKIRCGDSLVQNLGKDLIPLRGLLKIKEIPEDKLKHIINLKNAVYERGDRSLYEKAIKEEKNLLLNTLEYQIKKLKLELQKNVSQQYKLGIKDKNSPALEKLEILKKELELRNEIEYYEQLKEKISKLKLDEIPLIWELSFAEVFINKQGFDIVIANPPYVRQEEIDDLMVPKRYSKQEYKNKLIEQTRLDWLYDYDGKETLHPIPQKFNKQSDLYVYFYLKGLKLLNPYGVLCYISSNSWLDVGFGSTLQNILLHSCPIVAIYDNQAKRTFKHADVNTIIAVIKAPKINRMDKELISNYISFVNFKKPFEEVMYSDVFIELEENNEGFKKLQEGIRKETDLYRIHKINQKELRDINEKEEINKWGGKYLRAPEIYWKILEKGKDKFVKLGDIAEVRFGIKTGANEFFYVEDVTDEIEDE
jgi:type I restriction-modification system DNA methylase subunit